MGIQAKDLSIEVEVSAQFAADFFCDQHHKPLDTRPVLPLTLGDEDLGKWQVKGVRTVWRDAGYDVAVATLRAVWD